jgi:SAM-dependent methyltransferase
MPKPLLDKILRPSPMKRLRRQYRHNFDARRFDIDWSAIRYNRIALVNLLVAQRPEGRYLEIGCAGNGLFDSVPARHKTGVDPERGGTHRLTSDAFFAQAGDAKYDVIFIDGLHIYEQTRRDVTNALAHLAPGGWIAIHDMMPIDWLEEHVPCISGIWTGNVWKIGFELGRCAGIDFRLVKIDRGIGLVRPLRPDARLPDLGEELRDKRFGYFYDHAAALPLTDYETARQWIEAAASTIESS